MHKNHLFLKKDEFSCTEGELSKNLEDLVKKLKKGCTLILEGELGAGKTTVAKTICNLLKVVSFLGSPSFSIMNEYKVDDCSIVHIDLYRIKNESELEETGIYEVLWDPEKIVLIEWLSLYPDLMNRVIQKGNCWRITLEIDGVNTRKVKISSF